MPPFGTVHGLIRVLVVSRFSVQIMATALNDIYTGKIRMTIQNINVR